MVVHLLAAVLIEVNVRELFLTGILNSTFEELDHFFPYWLVLFLDVNSANFIFKYGQSDLSRHEGVHEVFGIKFWWSPFRDIMEKSHPLEYIFVFVA